MQKVRRRGQNNLVSLINFFTDPILFTTTIGSMLMGLASSLVGVLVFIRKRALIGETLSHATYPGIVLGIASFSGLFLAYPGMFPLIALIGAFISALIGMYLVHFLENKLSLNSDTALCFVLSSFLGIGVLIASRLQFSEPVWFQKVQALLYGQAATMLLIHVYVYSALVALIILFILLSHRSLKVLNFDRDFAKMLNVSTSWLDSMTFVLIVLAIVIGIRSVGVVLMAGMLIAPAAVARQFVGKLWQMFLVSSLFGILIGYLGIVVSVNGSLWLSGRYGAKIALPTGPVILIIATLFVVLALVFATRRGLISRVIRRKSFQMNCLEENILKYVYKAKGDVTFNDLKEVMCLYSIVLAPVLFMMRSKGLMDGFRLTEQGAKRAKRIIRLHRLWEVYLFTCLDVQAEHVHKSAEEMEHFITPELEEELVLLLGDPKTDPHNQEIPEK